MDTIRVVCGIIFNKERVLICRRKIGKSLSGYWEFAGGKVEADEKFEDSLTRELKEELGMVVEIKQHFKTVQHRYDRFNIELISFICKFKSASFILTDHDAYEWVKPSELLKWELAPADIPIANEIQRIEKLNDDGSRMNLYKKYMTVED